jgi:hypothetical protein
VGRGGSHFFSFEEREATQTVCRRGLHIITARTSTIGIEEIGHADLALCKTPRISYLLLLQNASNYGFPSSPMKTIEFHAKKA